MTAVQSVDYLVLAPVLVLAFGAVTALVVDLFVNRGPVVSGAIALVTVLGALAVLPQTSGGTTLCAPGGWCGYAADRTTLVIQGVMLASSALVVLLSLTAAQDLRLPGGEYFFLLLASVAGAVTVPATRDLPSLIVALEVVTLPTIALVALRRGTGRSGEAALKLFLYSVVALAVSLYGLALVYGATGRVDLAGLAVVIADPAAQTPVLAAGMVLLLAVVLFKAAAVPFQAWAPDAYQGAPLPVAAYLSVVSKTAGLAALVLLMTAFVGWWSVVTPALALSAAATMVVGNVAALRQRTAVRLLAWSSVAQAGYLLVPLGALAGGLVGAVDPVAAIVGFLVVYAAMNLGAFSVVSAVVRSSGSDDLAAFDGLAWRRPWLGLALALFLAALAGLPPGLAGLFVKLRVFVEPVGTGLWWLALVMGAATVVGLVYYLAWGARLFRRPTGPEVALSTPLPVALAAGSAVAATVVLSVAPTLALGLLG